MDGNSKKIINKYFVYETNKSGVRQGAVCVTKTNVLNKHMLL